MKRLVVLFALVVMAVSAIAQNNMRDVVYLKNGGITKGIIIEQVPSESLKIQTADGSVFVYKMDEIEKIAKEMPQTNNVTVTPVTPTVTNPTNFLLERDGTDICYVKGRSLSDDEILALVGQDRFDTYCGGRRQLRTGRTFATIGWITFGAAVTFLVAGEIDYDYDLMLAGEILAIPADIFLPLGFIFKGIGKGRINWVCDDYNENKGNISLNLTPAVMKTNIPGQNNSMAFGATLSLSF